MRSAPSFPCPALLVLLACAPATDPSSTIDAEVNAQVHGPITLGALVPGDELRVGYGSAGCFHAFEAELVITRDVDGTVGMTGSIGGEFPTAPPATPFVRRVLAADTVRGLDRMLALVRSERREGWCTTQSDYRLALYRDGALVREEQLHDRSCADFPEGEEVVGFWSVLEEPMAARLAVMQRVYAARGAEAFGVAGDGD